jgi:ADP-heptose:LPS heptosyltransferase
VPVPVVLIHPGSGGRAKCWPLACFIEMARQLRSSAGGERTDPSRERKRAVVFLVGPVERETWAPSELTALRDEFRVLCCPEPDELVVLLAAAAVVVGNDGGPGHLAALLGRPTVTIFGPTSPTVWRPLGPRSQVLVGDPETHPDDWGIAPEQVVRLIGGWR